MSPCAVCGQDSHCMLTFHRAKSNGDSQIPPVFFFLQELGKQAGNVTTHHLSPSFSLSLSPSSPTIQDFSKALSSPQQQHHQKLSKSRFGSVFKLNCCSVPPSMSWDGRVVPQSHLDSKTSKPESKSQRRFQALRVAANEPAPLFKTLLQTRAGLFFLFRK